MWLSTANHTTPIKAKVAIFGQIHLPAGKFAYPPSPPQPSWSKIMTCLNNVWCPEYCLLSEFLNKCELNCFQIIAATLPVWQVAGHWNPSRAERGPASLQPWEPAEPAQVHGHPLLSGHDLQEERQTILCTCQSLGVSSGKRKKRNISNMTLWKMPSLLYEKSSYHTALDVATGRN